MIPRRIHEHVKAHNWFAVAIDFVIVVAGVFIGIQVSNWNAARNERQAARTYIERLRLDLSENERNLAGRIAYYRQVRAHALAALAGFDAPEETLGEQFLIDAYQATQILARALDRSTYDEILAVGAMNAVPDLAVRGRLARYYQSVMTINEILAYVPPYRENLRRLMPYPVQEAISTKCDDVQVLDAASAPRPTLPERCELDLREDEAGAAVAAILNEELRRDLVRCLADIDTKIRNQQRLIDRGRELNQFLAEVPS